MRHFLKYILIVLLLIPLFACQKKEENSVVVEEALTSEKIYEETGIMIDVPQTATNVKFSYVDLFKQAAQAEFDFQPEEDAENLHFVLRASKNYSGPVKLGEIDKTLDSSFVYDLYSGEQAVVYVYKDGSYALDVKAYDTNYLLTCETGKSIVVGINDSLGSIKQKYMQNQEDLNN